MSKERRQSSSEAAAEGPTPSHSFLPPPDGLTRSHSSPALLDGSTPLYATLPDWQASLHEVLTPPGGPASLAVSSPPGEIVPATDQPVPVHSPTSTPLDYTLPSEPATGHRVPPRPLTQFQIYTMVNQVNGRLEAQGDTQRIIDARQMIKALWKKAVAGLAVIGITGGVVAYYRHLNHVHRTVDPDWYVSNPSHRSSCRPITSRITSRSSKILTHEIFLSSTAKGPRHSCLNGY